MELIHLDFLLDCINQRSCNSIEYMSARFNSLLWNLNKRKVDAELSGARRKQNCYSELTVNSNPDSNFCVNLLTEQKKEKEMNEDSKEEGRKIDWKKGKKERIKERRKKERKKWVKKSF